MVQPLEPTITFFVDSYRIIATQAEAFQKTVQTELAEAKVVQKYNAQLHKDLQREQLARKKLHNDMEDMKGVVYFYLVISFCWPKMCLITPLCCTRFVHATVLVSVL